MKLVLLFIAAFAFIAPSFGAAQDPKEFASRKDILKEFQDRFGKPIEEFFEDRDQSKVDEKEKAFYEAWKKRDYAKMDALRTNNSDAVVNVKEQKGGAEPKGLVGLLQRHGRCVTHVEKIGESEYISDGWCRLPQKREAGMSEADIKAQRERLAQAQDAAQNMLKDVDTYPKRSAGFNYLLEFVGVDPASGALLPSDKAKPMGNPFMAFVAVQGVAKMSFSYMSESFFKDRTSDGVKELILQFHRVTPPEDFSEPLIYNYPKTALSVPYVSLALQDVFGQWYVDAQGNLRYQTRADFGNYAVVKMENLARTIIMDTIYHLYLRVNPPVAVVAK